MDTSVCQCKCRRQDPVLDHVAVLYRDLLAHDGYGELKVDVRILKRRQREVIITCGEEHRYVVDAPDEADGDAPAKPPKGSPVM